MVFSVKEGWAPLCNFLNVPVPEESFPNTNDSAQMKKYIKINQVKAYSIVIGAPILVGICAYFYMKTNVFSNALSKITDLLSNIVKN